LEYSAGLELAYKAMVENIAISTLAYNKEKDKYNNKLPKTTLSWLYSMQLQKVVKFNPKQPTYKKCVAFKNPW